jgi:hypothetical protein
VIEVVKKMKEENPPPVLLEQYKLHLQRINRLTGNQDSVYPTSRTDSNTAQGNNNNNNSNIN